MKHTLSTIGALAVAVLGTSRLEAQPATASAEQLFRDGKRLMTEGNIAAACEAFDGSYRTEPTISTLLNLADCRERNQQYASAWGHFLTAARQARLDPTMSPMLDTAQRRAAALEARLSYLIINVPDDARVDGLTITRNGTLVDPAEWNRDIPVDGGTYRIEGKAPAYEAWSATITVGNAKDKQSVNVPRFSQAPRLAQSSTPAARPARPDVPPWYGDRPGWFLAGGGALGILVGAGFLLSASDLYAQADAEDQGSVAMDLEGRAHTRAVVGGVVGVAGVALLAAGVIKLALRPAAHEEDPRVEITLTPSGLGLWGRF